MLALHSDRFQAIQDDQVDASTDFLPDLNVQDRLSIGRRGDRFAVMIDWSQCPAVERRPDKLGGAWVFKGTRVPVRALFENIQGGARVDDFLEWFPGVTRNQVVAVLKMTEQSLDVVAA